MYAQQPTMLQLGQLPLWKTKKISWHLLKTGGSLMAIKGKLAEEEMKTVAKSLHEVNLEELSLGASLKYAKVLN